MTLFHIRIDKNKTKWNEYGNILTEWKFLYNSGSPPASKKNMIAASNTEGWHTSHLQIPFTEGLIHVHKDVQHSTVYNWNIRTTQALIKVGLAKWSRYTHITGKCTAVTMNDLYSFKLKNLANMIGEGDGTPLQYSCLENPMDRGAW